MKFWCGLMIAGWSGSTFLCSDLPHSPSCFFPLSFPFKSTNAVVVLLNKHHMTNDVDLSKVTENCISIFLGLAYYWPEISLLLLLMALKVTVCISPEDNIILAPSKVNSSFQPTSTGQSFTQRQEETSKEAQVFYICLDVVIPEHTTPCYLGHGAWSREEGVVLNHTRINGHRSA